MINFIVNTVIPIMIGWGIVVIIVCYIEKFRNRNEP